MLDFNTLVTGLLIFAARIAEVSIGTVRIIVTVQGRSAIAFFLAILELLIWIIVVSTVIHKLALGFIILRVITRTAGKSLADRIRAMGQPVTVFRGEGMRGPVDELYIACRRRELKRILEAVKEEDPDAFYLTEMAHDIKKTVRPPYSRFNGRRLLLKRR